MLLIHNAIEKNALATPQKEALCIDGESVSYSQLIKLVDKLTNTLKSVGTKPGDRIGIYATISTHAIAAFIATFRCGAITAAIHRTHSQARLSQLLKIVETKILITDLSDKKEPSSISDTLTATIIIPTPSSPKDVNFCLKAGGQLIEGNLEHYEHVLPTSPASIFFTSGSTFVPKGVLVDHKILISVMSRIIDYLKSSANDRILTYSGLSSDYGAYNILMPLYLGGTSVIQTRQPACHSDILEVLVREKVTGMHIFPPVLYMLTTSADTCQYSIPSLRYISSSGQSIYTSHLKCVRRIFPRVEIYSSYGLTEYKRVSYLDPKFVDIKPASVGKPLSGVRVYLVDDFEQLISTPGQTGELWIAGEDLMLGYWNDPTANRRAFEYNKLGESRLYKSGDLFKKDEDGFLYYIARKDNVFARNGWKVNPRDLEECLSSHSAVFSVLAIPLEDESAGYVPKVFVVLMENSKDTSSEELIEHCRNHLDWHMVPVECEIVEILPHTHSGKFSPASLM
ncbi:Linear gramicidin synthase subunit D [Pseudomonas fluorescens]|nr:Linear gramicidin synthase subunit D [Pseudomonas fluorescens]